MTQVEAVAVAPVARVYQEMVHDYPKDLYIPPEALKVFLDSFEGPLDLLLYLIKKQNIDILELPITTICNQYTQYIELMQDMKFELAAEYLLMAAMLAEIKSRLLLPQSPLEDEEDNTDPRAELVRRLQEYERYKTAAISLNALPRQERETCLLAVQTPEWPVKKQHPTLSLDELLQAMQQLLKKEKQLSNHTIHKEPLSVRQKMGDILEQLSNKDYIELKQLWTPKEGRLGYIVTFLAVLEMVKEKLVECVQTQLWAPIHVKRV